MCEVQAKTWLERDGHSILSTGRAKLLRLIETEGSLSKAAQNMGMSYRHAWGILRKIEEGVGASVVESTRGGKGGGESRLTVKGREILRKFDLYNDEIQKVVRYGAKPALTVDGIVLVDGQLILIRRKNPPYQHRYALPGGFVDYGETTEDAVRRELLEEISVQTEIVGLVGVYSHPDRDPRGHTVSVVYHCRIVGGKVHAADDAAAVDRFDLDELPALAFDHDQIVADFCQTQNHFCT